MKHVIFECGQFVLRSMRELLTAAAGSGECVVCGGRCGAVPVCTACRSTYFALTTAARCTECGKELISEHGMCMQCRSLQGGTRADLVFPLYSYRLWNSVLLFRWKSAGERALSLFFAERLAAALNNFPQRAVVVPVPPRPGKIRKKGWDQVEELCRFLELRWNYRVCRILERHTAEQQKVLNRAQRLETAGRSYALKTGRQLKKGLAVAGGMLPGSVCLIDDVMTTGATIAACVTVLKAAGVQTVRAVTLFTVD